MKEKQPSSVPDQATPSLGRRAVWLLAACMAFVAFDAYVLTLSPSTYPGESATLMAVTTHAAPQTSFIHPVWRAISWVCLKPHLLPMVVQLNLSSAIFGAAAVGVTFLLIAWCMWTALSQKERLDQLAVSMPSERSDDDRSPSPAKKIVVSPDAPIRQRLINTAAMLGGFTAACLLAFNVAFWSAATRFQYQTLDLLLLVCVSYGLLRCHRKNNLIWLAVTSVVWGLGIGESPEIVFLTPVLIILLVGDVLIHKEGRDAVALIALSAIIGGIGISMLLVWLNVRVGNSGSVLLAEGIWLSDNIHQLMRAVRLSGDTLFLLQTLIPFLIALFAAQRIFSRPTVSIRLLNLLLAATVVVNMQQGRASPWWTIRTTGHLPVVDALLVALTAAYLAIALFFDLISAYLVFSEHDVSENNKPGNKRLHACFAVGIAMLALLCASPWRVYHEADGRKSAFADVVAGYMVQMLNGRDTLIGGKNLIVDNVLIAAKKADVRLTLVSPHDRMPAEIDWSSSRHLAPDWKHLAIYQAVPEWFVSSTQNETHAAVVAPASLWPLAGYYAVPHGLFFVGAQDLSKLSATSLDEWHRHFWEALNRELPATNGLPVLLLKPRNNIARQAGLVANSLGVLFEKLHEPEKAWNAYAQARRLDSENFCALLNQVFLSSSGDIHPESHDELQFELDQAVRQRHSIPDAYVLINTNGDICHPERYNDMRMRWDPASPENQANLAFQELSDFGMEHALDIRGLLWAALNIRPSTFTNREQACKSRLMANPADGRALTELSLLAVCQGQTDDAQHWVDLAFHAGVANSNLCLPKAAIRLASCRPDLAEPELTAALNDRQAGDLTLWTCLGAALFQEHNIKDIEHRVLPGMRAVCPSEEDWRIQTIQAYLALNQKGSDAFSKARTSFLCALRLHPNMPTVRNALLWIDVVRANMLNIEQDASDTLLYAPSDAFATFLLAKALISQQTDLPRAESLLKTSLTTRCTSIALAWLSDAQRQQNRLSEAEQTARDALKINDHACVPWEKLSYVLMDQNRDEEAFAAIQHALRYANSSPSALLQKAVLLARMERLNEAEEIAAREHTDWQNLPENLMNLRRDLEAKIDAARPRKKINYGL